MVRFEKILEKLYYDPSSPSAFSGARRLVEEGKKHGVPKKKVEQWLSKQDAYTLHKKVTRKFRKRSYVLVAPGDLWQADLADLSNLAQENDGFKYWLVVIDTFTKFVWVKLQRDKTATCTTDAFAAILDESSQTPNNVNTDKGTEFTNARFQALLASRGINFYTSENPDTKAAFAERVIRTLKEKLYRFLTHKHSQRYIDNLDEIVQSYNNAVHSATGVKPVDVSADNEDLVRRQLQQNSQNGPSRKPRYSAGDRVRITRGSKAFRKGYSPAWTEEIFSIAHVLQTEPSTYSLQDFAGENIKGSFYENELQKVAKKQVYRIERIIRTRKINNVSESLVKWLGYPMAMASWVRTDDILPL